MSIDHIDHADYREPLKPQPSTPACARTDYKITYRDPATGEEFQIRADVNSWRYQKGQLVKMGYDVLVEKQHVQISAWEVVGGDE